MTLRVVQLSAVRNRDKWRKADWTPTRLGTYRGPPQSGNHRQLEPRERSPHQVHPRRKSGSRQQPASRRFWRAVVA